MRFFSPFQLLWARVSQVSPSYPKKSSVYTHVR
jgi:hypothetical protein